jgi:hypothetical protein
MKIAEIFAKLFAKMQSLLLLRGQSHEIFDLWFFFSRQTVPLGPLIHGLNRFRI